MAEARSVMVEGESGLLACAGNGMAVRWEPSLRRLCWENGATANIYSAAEPDALRGPQHHFAWADEIAKWPSGIAAWDNLMMGLRLGVQPRVVATTTPRPVPLLKRLHGARGVELTVGRTLDNAANLPPAYIRTMQAEYGGRRIGRQELDGELIEDAEGALWTRDGLELCRMPAAPEQARVVIGVDPPASSNGDACGIIVAGLCKMGEGWVLADESVSGRSPEGWAGAVAAAAARWRADRVVAEKNNGGDMVESVLRAADVSMPIRLVHASRGKVPRAEPVAALYEKRRVHHAGAFPALEDELCGLIAGGAYEGPGKSPDRADALVWAMTELMLGKRSTGPRVRTI
jgi:phage terminase large subunit-like protein